MQTEVRSAPALLPPLLEEVALIDARTAAATGAMKVSWWNAKVAAGEAPQPVIREARCTRWRLTDVRTFWQERAEKGSDPVVAQRIRAQALKASGIASKRLAEQAAAA